MDKVEIKNWDDLDLKGDLLRGIYGYGFEKPSEIQKKAIHPIINNHDVIAQAQSGTGKTGTFSIASLQVVDTTQKSSQVIIITSTRELAIQTHTVLSNIGMHLSDLSTKLLIGGTSVNADVKELSENAPHIVVGTPGRIFDMVKRRKLDLETMKLFILDEADEMLSSCFKDQIKTIFTFFNKDIQTALFSATLPRDVIELTTNFMKSPVHLTMKAHELTLDGIEQYFIAAQDDQHKYESLKDLFNKLPSSQSIIFVNGIQRVNDLCEFMERDGFSVNKIHSSLDKNERAKVLDDFKKNMFHILISSDLTARGIDIQQISMVVNFDIPNNVNTYLHRIGRSGRWGRKGSAVNFICQNDVYMMKRIETHYKINIREFNII